MTKTQLVSQRKSESSDPDLVLARTPASEQSGAAQPMASSVAAQIAKSPRMVAQREQMTSLAGNAMPRQLGVVQRMSSGDEEEKARSKSSDDTAPLQELPPEGESLLSDPFLGELSPIGSPPPVLEALPSFDSPPSDGWGSLESGESNPLVSGSVTKDKSTSADDRTDSRASSPTKSIGGNDPASAAPSLPTDQQTSKWADAEDRATLLALRGRSIGMKRERPWP